MAGERLGQPLDPGQAGTGAYGGAGSQPAREGRVRGLGLLQQVGVGRVADDRQRRVGDAGGQQPGIGQGRQLVGGAVHHQRRGADAAEPGAGVVVGRGGQVADQSARRDPVLAEQTQVGADLLGLLAAEVRREQGPAQHLRTQGGGRAPGPQGGGDPGGGEHRARAAVGRPAEHQSPHPVGEADGQLLRDHAAHRQPVHVGGLHAQPVEQPDRVAGQLGDGRRAPGSGRAPGATAVVADAVELGGVGVDHRREDLAADREAGDPQQRLAAALALHVQTGRGGPPPDLDERDLRAP